MKNPRSNWLISSRQGLTAIFCLLLLSGDAGVVALRDSVLLKDVPVVSTSEMESSQRVGSPAERALWTLGESAKSSAVLLPLNEPAGHKLAFADGTLSSSSSTGVFPFDPVSLTTTLVFTVLTAVLNHLAGLNLARAALLRQNFDKEVQGIVGETADSMRNMGKAYATITGDIGRRLRDALAETAVSVVQHLPDADIVKAAQRVTSNTENPILQAHHRLNKSLPFDATADVRLAPLHSCLSAYSNAQATDAKDKAMVSLRQSLMALVEDDFNLLSGIGSLGRFGDDTNPADGIRVIDFTTELSEPARTLMETAASVAGSSADMKQDELFRMRTMAMRSAAAADDVKAVEEYEAALAKRSTIKPVRLESEEMRIGALDAQQLVDTVSDYFGKATATMKNSLILAKAAHSAVTPAAASAINTVATVTQYLGFVGSIASVTTAIMAGVGLHTSQKVGDFEIFEGARNTGVAHERGEADRRITAAVMCRMMDSLRTSINTFLSVPFDKLKSGKAEKLVEMLGLTAFELPQNAKIRVAVTLYTRLCAMYSAMIQRINALFRANGECKVQLAHLTGAADTVPGKAVSGPGKPPLTQVETAVARYETCQLGMECENDIYDVQLVDFGDGYEVLLKAHYELVTDPDASWDDKSPEGQKFLPVQFGGELNAEVTAIDSAALEGRSVQQKANSGESRKLVVLRWKTLHKEQKEPVPFWANFNVNDPAQKAAKDGLGDYFNELRRRKFPVSDLVVSLLHKETDMMNEIAFAAQGPQADLQAAGYQLLMPRFSEHTESHPNVPSRAAMIRDMLTDLKNAGTIKYTSAALMKADVKKGRGKNKPYTFIHIMRGNGISALKGIVLAPFVATNAVVLKGTNVLTRSNAYEIKDSFVTTLTNAAASKQGKEMEARPTGMVVPWAHCNAWARARHFKETWLVDGFWTFINPIERKKTKEFNFGLHEYTLNCTTAAGSTAVWERVAVSPYNSNNRALPRLLKPYLWLNRRYVLPAFSSGDDLESPACPWMCDSNLKDIIIPPPVRPFDALKKEMAHAFSLSGAIK